MPPKRPTDGDYAPETTSSSKKSRHAPFLSYKNRITLFVEKINRILGSLLPLLLVCMYAVFSLCLSSFRTACRLQQKTAAEFFAENKHFAGFVSDDPFIFMLPSKREKF